MKKILTLMCAFVMIMASATIAFADDGEPIAAITNAYTFEGANQDASVVDKWANPFKNLGLDKATIQYTVTIPAQPKYLTGYDTVMTFGTKNTGFLYICNELVGMNSGGFVDYWPSGQTASLCYPGRGETYTVNLVFSQDGVAFYVNGEQKPGSNTPAANNDGEVGVLTGADMMNLLNTESVLYFGDDTTISYWAEQDMTLTNIIFFKGEVTSPYTLQGTEPKAARVNDAGEAVTEATKATQSETQAQAQTNNTATTAMQENADNNNITLIMIIVIVVIVAVIGVAAMVILSQKRR